VTPGANVASIDALATLRQSFIRYRSDLQETLDQANRDVQAMLAWIAERVSYWQAMEQRCTADVQATGRALAACRASGYRDSDGNYHAPNCSQEEAALNLARARLTEARSALEVARQWKSRLEQASEQYAREARNLRAKADHEVPQAIDWLSAQIATLEEYVTGSADILAGASLSNSVSGVAGTAGHGVLDRAGWRAIGHSQGQNSRGFRGTCGLVCCEGVLRAAGVSVDENALVEWAFKTGNCDTHGEPEDCGGTVFSQRQAVLAQFGMRAQLKEHGSLEDLAQWVDNGRGVTVVVSSAKLWGRQSLFTNPSNLDHAILVTEVVRDAHGEVLGYFANDSGVPAEGGIGRYIDADLMRRCWLDCGGWAEVPEPLP